MYLHWCMLSGLIEQYKKMLEWISELDGRKSCQLHELYLLEQAEVGFFICIRKAVFLETLLLY